MTDRAVLVTGASNGIGLAIARSINARARAFEKVRRVTGV